MALLNPTFLFGVFVLVYLSSFIFFAVLRIITGISIQRIGYFSLRRLAYTPKDGVKFEIRGLGLNVHRPTFAQPTWLSIVVNDLTITVDVRELQGKRLDDTSQDASSADGLSDESDAPPKEPPRVPRIRRNGAATQRSETWKHLMKLKERVKRLHRKIKWLRMVDVVATNSTINIVDVGNIQCGSFTLGVDTRRKMVDRARFFFQFRTDRRKNQRQAEWIMTVRSVLFTAEGGESLEVLDNATLNIHGFLYEALDGLRDATIGLKLNRVHIPYDDVHLCFQRYKRCKSSVHGSFGLDESPEFFNAKGGRDSEDSVLSEQAIMQTVSDSKEFVSSILRGVKEVQFAVSFVGITKKVDSVKPHANPVLLNASLKEVGVDLHRLDPKSPAHRMYFPSKDIAHEALAAALSISVGLDDGLGKPERLLYIPMTTTTVKTTLPSKTVELAQDGSAEAKNANILFANSVITSPSVDLDPRHLPLLIAMLQPRPKHHRIGHQQSRLLLSRLLPKANIKFTMHEPVVRITLPPVDKSAPDDDFDLIISSISSISLDVESSHSTLDELHYSLASTTRLQSLHLYYQTSGGDRFDLVDAEAFDLRCQLSAAPDVHVVATGNIDTFAIKMVRPEITDGLRQIIRQLRLNVEPKKRLVSKAAHNQNFLRAMPSWLLQFQFQATDVSLEVAGVDEEISDDTRGVSLQLDSLTSEYRAQRLEGLQRRTSRRRANSRTMTPDTDLLKAPLSPRKKQQNFGDGRRVTFHVRGLEAYIVEGTDRVEPEPFVNMPRFEVALQALSDQQGPIFHIHAGVRSVLCQYSLYRHYCVGVAVMVLRKAFMRTQKDTASPRPSASSRPGAGVDHLAPPMSPEASVNELNDMSTLAPELVSIDVKVAMLQVKADLPHDPPMLFQIFGVETGRHRWSAPFFVSKQIRICVQPPRIRGVWARMLCIKGGRIDYRISRRKLPSGQFQEERMYDIVADAVRFAIPHEVAFNQVSDNLVNVFKTTKQLHHRFRTGTNEYILDKLPEGPKNVPKISLRTKAFLFELEDGAFEWKLGMIYKAGRAEQLQRLAREEAFELKRKKIREEENRKESHKHRARSLFHRSRGKHDPSERRSRSVDGRERTSEDRGRTPRYDPDGGCYSITGQSKVAEQEARVRLDAYNATSWKRRIDRYYNLSRKGMRDLRGAFWGPDRLPDDLEEAENILEVPQRPSLMSTIISNVHFQIDKPTFPMRELPDFIHSVGKGMPKDMVYGLLVPMHVSMDIGELRMTLRDYPLPLMHIPALKAGQNQRTSAMSLRTNFVIAEEYRGVESTRRVKVHITPLRNLGPGGTNEGSFAIDVRRTIGPIKSFSDMRIDINTALPTRITWGGPCYQPAIQDMMMVIESFTKPQVDPSERVGFWDKIRLNFHSRIHVAWRGDGDLHLALKGTRDPYCVTGNGAGFIMCWRNDIKWNINANEDPKQFMTVDSGEYVWAIPDYSHQVREAHRKLEGDESLLTEDDYRRGIQFKKVIMKLSGKVQWMAGMVFERAIEDGKRSFDFKPHYDVVLRSPQHVQRNEGGLPYDAFRGFRSQHIHLSIAVRAPVDRDWMDTNPTPSRSYNAVHCTPRFFTHFFSWWSLFGGPLSLPIRQGRLWPGREKVSKKFGKHLATIKYNLLLAPVFMSHIYKHKDVEDYSENAVSATGLKVRFDSFMLDLHQRREEFNTRDRGRKTSGRTSGMKIHAAQLDLAAADVRAVSASIRGTTTEAIKKGTLANLSTDQAETADPSRFSIPDNDLTWIDMDDFVELDWILPSEPNPDTKILPLAYAPRVTYFRQTDIGGSIAGDPDRTSPFGQEPTHFCIMSKDDDTRQVQAHLVHERLSQLEVQIENHGRNLGEAELKMVRDGGKDAGLATDFEALRRHSGVLHDKKIFLEAMLQQLEKGSPTNSQLLKVEDREGGFGPDAESMSIPAGAEFESDAQNRFVIHNLHFKWNNLLRNIVLRYIHQVSQRRGFVYYLSRPAVKFILDIVEEQLRAKQTTKPFHTQSSASNTSPDPSSAETEVQEDIEDRIRRILKDGRKFVNADQDTPMDNTPNVAMDDLTSGISDDFRARNNYHVRVIAPQLQFQSDKNKKNVVLLTAKGMELKVVEVMDRERLSDPVSGLVQRRFLVTMDSTQFFVTHQKWFSTHLVSMYAGSQYGTPVTTSWPPWVPMEVMFDFQTDPFGFKRVVQKTSAMLRYDKYNTLRLKYNDEVNSEGANPLSQPATESRVDNLWVEFPQARALCNSAQYYAMYVIVLDLLMYSEPLEKTRSERLEKIMLASDFSDLSGAPEMVQKLQERIRQLEDIKSHFQIYSKYLDQQGWEDRLLVERDLAACEDELFFMMKAITTSQRKYDTNAQSNALLRWSIMAREIVWHLLRDNNEPLVELQLKDVEYDRTDHSDGSHMNLVRVGKVLGLNLLPDAIYPEMIAPYVDPERAPSSDSGENEMIRVYWNMLEAIAGIPIMDQFEVTLFPLKIQLERELGKRLFEYIFPDMTGEKATRNDSPFMLKHNLLEEEEEEGESLASSAGRLGVPPDKDGFNTRPGSLELRLHPTLTSDAASPKHTSIKKSLTAGVSEGHSFRLFRSGATGKTALKKSSYESLRSSNVPKPGTVGRSSTGNSTRDGNSATSEKKSRFGLRKGDKQDEADDLTKMMTRASSYMTFAYISMPSVVLCLSYKGKESRNFEDVHDFVFRMPAIEWRNKTWSNLDLALALKKAVIKALISHTGAIIGNKFKLRPNTAQTSKLRELANNSSLIAPTPSSMSQHYAESMNSDDSSSIYGTSPVDYSRSPPRSLHGSSHSSIPAPRSASRSSSVASSRSYRNASGGSANQRQPAGPPVPSFLMMTPPTPQDSGPAMANRLEPIRPMTSGGLSPYSHSGNPRRPGSSRSSVGGGFLRDKLSALTHRMREGSSGSQKTEEEGGGSEEGSGTPESAGRVGKRLSWAPSRAKTG